MKTLDLFVFAPDHSRFWFAEIKGPGYSLHGAQKLSHEAIRDQLGVRIELIRVAVEEGEHSRGG